MAPDTCEIGDLTVTRLGFGAMRLCGSGIIGPPADEAAARAVLQRAVELGVDFVDTADAYGPGVDERLIREALHPYPEDLTVATKAGLLRHVDGDWVRCGDPAYLHDAVLSSRDRLGVETIDLLQLHRPDPDVPIEDSVAELAEMRDRGLIANVGLSNVDVDQLDRASEVAEVVSVQNRYSVVDRRHEDVLAACEERDLAFVPWAPIAGGDFGDAADALAAVADDHDATPSQVALAWLLEHSPVVCPIPGTSSLDHLEENVAAAYLSLSASAYERLAAVDAGD
ncbi:MAG: aldo/keto reductase [Halobacteriaceae archaeon]